MVADTPGREIHLPVAPVVLALRRLLDVQELAGDQTARSRGHLATRARRVRGVLLPPPLRPDSRGPIRPACGDAGLLPWTFGNRMDRDGLRGERDCPLPWPVA